LSVAKKSAGRSDRLQIDGREVPVTNLDKVLYPENGFTKAQVIDYYIRVSQYLLPHFENRPVTLKRFPDGVRGQAFYEKDAPGYAPEWVKTFPVPRRAGGTDIQYILINDLSTLVWCANVASLELHPFLHCVPEIQQPRSVVFDLDPGEGTDLLTCAEVAFLLRNVLRRLGLEAIPKVSGSKGLQVYVPLNTAVSYAATQPFARALADLLTKEHPNLIVAEMAKSQRPKKVFIDWSQNSDFKTTVGVYSLRAKRDRPFASLPVGWDELERALKSRKGDALFFEPEAALTRLSEVGDLFAPVLQLKQSLPASVKAASPPTTPIKALKEYQQKRDFSKTAEPAPTLPRASKQGAKKRFVVQKHAASHLHYDFRLEMHDALKSWAVPKGVPYEPEQRRLAMATEDHPIEYLDFEGTIPEGQYGGGTVMVWDIGTYELIEGNYYKGNLQIYLSGKKLKGEWHLTKDRKTNKNWYLLKTGAAMKPPSAKKENASALTGRTLEEIAKDKTAQWHSNRTSVPGIDLDQLPRSAMKFLEPMQCELVADLPEGDDWQYELKLDGYRALAIKEHGEATLLSRRNNSLNTKFTSVIEGLNTLEDGIILDGEVVALDDQGRPSFNRLQHLSKNQVLMYYVFDLLAYRGRDITGLALTQRREFLTNVLRDAIDPIRMSAVMKAAAKDLIEAIREQGLEGVIAKRTDSRYEPGARSGRWVKYKVNQGQEVVIGGYKPSGKNHFDNLAVGYYDGDRLIFIAKIKNGFTPAMKDEIYERVKPYETKTCPFANLPEPKNARRGEALTAEAMKKYRWLRPEVVAQVEFTDWTAADHLRHSKFVALRDDKNPREVVHETAGDVNGRSGRRPRPESGR
jgi:bifunctional non-homologous end joining protein LigD